MKLAFFTVWSVAFSFCAFVINNSADIVAWASDLTTTVKNIFEIILIILFLLSIIYTLGRFFGDTK